MKKKLNKLIKRNSATEVDNKPARITNKNLAENREEVLGSARRFIYPLQHSKHKLIKITFGLLLVAIVIFFSYCVLALYQFKHSSSFLYQVTKVVPFPIARIGSDFVDYENYLFEINHYTHYYKTQQNLDFDSESGQQQLAEYKKRALRKVVNDAYVRKLASQKGISVSEQEVDEAIATIRSQNRLGSSDQEFENVLSEFWDWSVADFRRSLKQQILNEKIIASLDSEAQTKANDALAQIKDGKKFAEVARKFSEDPATKQSGGEYQFEIDKNNRDISPKTVEALFKLKPGEVSEVINVGYGLQIVKNISQKGDKIRAAQITINFKDLEHYLNEIKDKYPARTYVNF